MAAGWLEDDTKSVIQCDDVQLYTFLSCTQLLEQWLRQPESGSIMVAIFFAVPLFHFQGEGFPQVFMQVCPL